MSEVPAVVAVILNWNRADDTLACLQSVKCCRYSNLSLLVIDNGSSDGSAERLRREAAGHEVLFLPDNLGFAGGCNRGMRRAMAGGAQYVWLLNNDARPAPDCLAALVAAAEADARVGAVGSVFFGESAGAAPEAWGGGRISFVLGRARHLRGPAPGRPDYLVGASLLLRVRALEQVGLFDERFFLYWEDADLCRRLVRRQWCLVVAEQARVAHAVSASLRDQPWLLDEHFNRSAALFFRKHSRAPWPPILIGGFARSAKRLSRGDIKGFAAVWRGLLTAPRTPTSRGAPPHRTPPGSGTR